MAVYERYLVRVVKKHVAKAPFEDPAELAFIVAELYNHDRCIRRSNPVSVGDHLAPVGYLLISPTETWVHIGRKEELYANQNGECHSAERYDGSGKVGR